MLLTPHQGNQTYAEKAPSALSSTFHRMYSARAPVDSARALGEEPTPQAAVGRPLHGGWQVARGLGLYEELPVQGWAVGTHLRMAHATHGGQSGEGRTNDTHSSTTDPEARLARKGPGWEARLCCMGHVLMEHRKVLAVDVNVSQATGTAEREAAAHGAWKAIHHGRSRQELQHPLFAQTCRQMKLATHVAQRRR